MSDTPLTHSDNQEPTAFTQAQLEWLPWLPPLPEDELTDRHCAGLVDAARVPENGVATVRIWQANIGKTIIAHVPVTHGEVQETGDFELDGVTFPAAEVQLEFIDPADEGDGDGGGAHGDQPAGCPGAVPKPSTGAAARRLIRY